MGNDATQSVTSVTTLPWNETPIDPPFELTGREATHMGPDGKSFIVVNPDKVVVYAAMVNEDGVVDHFALKGEVSLG